MVFTTETLSPQSSVYFLIQKFLLCVLRASAVKISYPICLSRKFITTLFHASGISR